MRNRVDVIHGVNFDVLDKRPSGIYGGLKLTDLELKIKGFAGDLGFEARFLQTNHEGAYCEFLHRAAESADGVVLNPGAWTHYSWAIRDALEVCALPAVEVHISEVDGREDWRAVSVIRDICVGRVQGKGVDGYREALEILGKELA